MSDFSPLIFIANHAGMNLADAVKEAYEQGKREAQPKTGKWVKPTGMMPPEYKGIYRCSECDEIAMRDWKELHHQTLTNFCPNCGCRMKEGE